MPDHRSKAARAAMLRLQTATRSLLHWTVPTLIPIQQDRSSRTSEQPTPGTGLTDPVPVAQMSNLTVTALRPCQARLRHPLCLLLQAKIAIARPLRKPTSTSWATAKAGLHRTRPRRTQRQTRSAELDIRAPASSKHRRLTDLNLCYSFLGPMMSGYVGHHRRIGNSCLHLAPVF